MSSRPLTAPSSGVRLRQAVIAAADLDAVAGRLAAELGLGQPFQDPAVGYFGLRNAVFALGDTFLEVVSPVRAGTAAGRLLERRGGDCGYMLMFQVPSLAAARARAEASGVREVFAVELEDMAEVHLHPGDMRGAIVSLSEPRPAEAWRWGGPDWAARSAPLTVTGASVAVAEPETVAARWRAVVGTLPGVGFVADLGDSGLVEIALAGWGAFGPESAARVFGPESAARVFGPESAARVFGPESAARVLDLGRVRVVVKQSPTSEVQQ